MFIKLWIISSRKGRKVTGTKNDRDKASKKSKILPKKIEKVYNANIYITKVILMPFLVMT